MKILFYGDSITDAGRNRNEGALNDRFGAGYVMQIAGRLFESDPTKYEIINTGVSGNRIVDLYARIKRDCINHAPDMISILIGINDIWHEIGANNGVALPKFKKIYRMMLEEILEALPNVKIILCEPFVLSGRATVEKMDRFLDVYDYAKAIRELAEEFSLDFLPLQEKLSEVAKAAGDETLLYDGVHPSVTGAAVIAGEWLRNFEAKY